MSRLTPVYSLAILSSLSLAACGGQTMVSVSAGTFTMGSPGDEVGGYDDETQHEVTLTHDFKIGATEMTQGEFEAVMGYNPSYFTSCGNDCPVENLSWHEAAAFANSLSDAAGLSACFDCTGTGSGVSCTTVGDPYTCEGYRLPTEAEWEYAGRAGSTAAFADGGNLVSGTENDCDGSVVLDNGDVLDDFAWYCGNASAAMPQPVGSLDANAWGLYDMSGNVYEWAWDWYDNDYPSGSSTDPTGASTGADRVNRGGSCYTNPRNARLANRNSYSPGYRYYDLGLRLARRVAAPSSLDP